MGLFRPKSQSRRPREVRGRGRSHQRGWLPAGCGPVPPSPSSATRGGRPGLPRGPRPPRGARAYLEWTAAGPAAGGPTARPPPGRLQRCPPGTATSHLPEPPGSPAGRLPPPAATGRPIRGPGAGPDGGFPRGSPAAASEADGRLRAPPPLHDRSGSSVPALPFVQPDPGAGGGGGGIGKSVHGGRAGKEKCLLPITAVRSSS